MSKNRRNRRARTTARTPLQQTHTPAPAVAATPKDAAQGASSDPIAAASEPQAQVIDISVGTDAAFAAPLAPKLTHGLRNISEIRHFFRTNNTPIFFVGATPFNLLGLDRWVRNFSYISYYDAWDGAHPRMFTPARKEYREFESGEDVNNWLLRNAEVRAHIARLTPAGERPKIVLVFFNERTEHICEELGYDLILPPAALRERLDSKIVTTQLGNEAGVPSVPNVLTQVGGFPELMEAANAAGLGSDLVVQTPYGDSGKTTFFISTAADWNRYAEQIIGEDIKVMRRINNRPVAVEAVLTRCGTVVGPYMTELAGYEELTPYRGGWCGNEMHATVLEGAQRARANELVRRLGDRLGAEGYRGFFEIDLLVDTDSDAVYLGELNPRISGASAITNVTSGAYADVPLFLFHLLEFMDVEFTIDVEEINQRWEELACGDDWSQMIIKETDPIVEQLTSAPRTGQYYFDQEGTLVFRRAALDWHQLQNENEAFFLRIYGVGDYRWKGSDLGILVTKGGLQVKSPKGGTALSIRAQDFIESVRSEFRGIAWAAPSDPKADTPAAGSRV